MFAAAGGVALFSSRSAMPSSGENVPAFLLSKWKSGTSRGGAPDPADTPGPAGGNIPEGTRRDPWPRGSVMKLKLLPLGVDALFRLQAEGELDWLPHGG